MGYWDTRTSTLSRLEYLYDKAKDYRNAISPHIEAMNVHASAGEWAEAFYDCWNAFVDVTWTLSYLTGKISGYSSDYGILYFLNEFTIAEAEAPEEFELTWEKIVTAWTNADKLGRLWTILSIDFMRKEVWNEPVTSFQMASGQAAGQ